MTQPEPDETPLISYEAFLHGSDEDVAAEWLDGRVVLTGSSSNRHQQLLGFLLASLSVFAEERTSGIVRSRPFQMKLATTGREPDLLYIAPGNLDRLREKYLDGPADLAVEITSLESRARDRGEKFYEYEAGGVREYWLLDPDREQAEFYVRDERGSYQLATFDKGVFESLVLPGLKLTVAWLWQDPLPPLMNVLKSWGPV